MRSASQPALTAPRLPEVESGYAHLMTIPDVGRCIGSGEPPRDGTVQTESASETGVCVACSGRFELRNEVVVEHETAAADERESVHE